MKRILLTLAIAVPVAVAVCAVFNGRAARASSPIFEDTFGGSTVDSQFTALGDASLTEADGVLHVDVSSLGGVKFTPTSSTAWAVRYKIIPKFASEGVGWIREDHYVKEGGSGTEVLGNGNKIDNSTGKTYRVVGDGSGNDVLVEQQSFDNLATIEDEDEWKYDDVFGIPVGCYCRNHKAYWVPPFVEWDFGPEKPRKPAVASFTGAKLSKLEFWGTDDFDLDDFTIDDSSLARSYVTLSPRTGATAGGTSVQMDAHGDLSFTSTTAVTVGGTSVSYTIVSATRITFTTPAHAAGEVDVEFTKSGTDYRERRGFKYQ